MVGIQLSSEELGLFWNVFFELPLFLLGRYGEWFIRTVYALCAEFLEGRRVLDEENVVLRCAVSGISFRGLEGAR